MSAWDPVFYFKFLFFIAVLISLLGLQFYFAHTKSLVGLTKKRIVNFSLGLLNVGLALIFGPMVGLLNTHEPSWLEVLIAILALDFTAYIFHRFFHRSHFLFRFHGVHHSDPHIEVSSAMRFHFGEFLITTPFRLGVVFALGFSYQSLIIFEAVFLVFNLAEHANLRLPNWLSRVLGLLFVTPALHRRHHSIQPSEMNSNFGTIFTLWDRIFGTLTPSKEKDCFPMGLKPKQEEISLKEALWWPFRRQK